MEKRILLAVILMTGVIMLTNLLFPPEPVEEPVDTASDTTEVVSRAPSPSFEALPELTELPSSDQVVADSVTVRTPLYTYTFSTAGAALTRAVLHEHESYTGNEFAQLVPEGERFLQHRLAVGADTIDLSRLPFTASETDLQLGEESGTQSITFSYSAGNGFAVTLNYGFDPERYVVDIDGRVEGVGSDAVLLTRIAPGLEQNDAPGHHSYRDLAVASSTAEGKVRRLALRKIDADDDLAEPLNWVGIKDRYFLAVLVRGDDTPFMGAELEQQAPRSFTYPESDDTVAIPQARVDAALPLNPDGSFDMVAYFGPQSYDRLQAVGYDLEDVTPYSYRWLQPIIRPFAAAILWVLALMHNTLGVAYGWVLVLFGVLMRVILWPLNARAMRSQMKNMAVQPLMQEIREKYKDNPQKQQEETMKLIKEHGFNPLGGCLPMLVPFPVLITLFFVFQNTIVFRGVDFLWIPDLSLQDPWLILPAFLVISMFALQYISTKVSGMEQNPQMKMMMYGMPIMMGVLFFNLPAGLNLYYATTNVASIPQQLLIAKERKAAQEKLKAEREAAKPKRPAPVRKKKRKK